MSDSHRAFPSSIVLSASLEVQKQSDVTPKLSGIFLLGFLTLFSDHLDQIKRKTGKTKELGSTSIKNSIEGYAQSVVVIFGTLWFAPERSPWSLPVAILVHSLMQQNPLVFSPPLWVLPDRWHYARDWIFWLVGFQFPAIFLVWQDWRGIPANQTFWSQHCCLSPTLQVNCPNLLWLLLHL